MLYSSWNADNARHRRRRTGGRQGDCTAATQEHWQVVSELARRALHRPPAPSQRNGVPLLAQRDDQVVVTLETVNSLRRTALTFLPDVNALVALIDPAHAAGAVTGGKAALHLIAP